MSPDGTQLKNNPEEFKFAIGAQLYRIQATSYPIARGSLNLNALKNPVLETGEEGKYTSSLSSCVSPVENLERGVYVLIVSTFSAQ